jgi:hypothetical protein
MKFKGKSNGTHIMCLGSLDQDISDRSILAVFEALLDFCHHNVIFDINQDYRATNFQSNGL